MDEDDAQLDALIARLTRTLGLSRAQATRAVLEVFDALDETPDAFIARRHDELQRQGLSNREIYARLVRELDTWRFTSPPYTERQIRRRVYGG
jgi:hypothetical protein